MKKTLFFGLMAAALGFVACSEENESIFTEGTQTGMILNATVSAGIDTRAIIDNSDEIWPFNFSSGDKVVVTNPTLSEGESYEFTSDLHHFSCTVAQPASSPVIWTARYPNHAVDLTDQTGKLEDVAKNYALVGSTSDPTTGASGLNIDMEAKVAILKIINGGGHLELNMKKSATEWVTGLSADDFSLTTSTSETNLFETDEAGDHYVVVPAGIQLTIKDGNSISLKSTTVDGFTAGKYYTMTINGAVYEYWPGSCCSDYRVVETVELQVGVAKPTSGYINLNSTGDLWGVSSSDGKTVYIQTNRTLIKAYSGGGMFYGFEKVKEIKNLNLVDWTGATSFAQMFYNCKALEEVDLSGICSENATDFESMFYGCTALKKIKNLSQLNTTSATNMQGMFCGCQSLTDLDVSTFNTSKVTNMASMFWGVGLSEIKGLKSLNTANVTNMTQMFGSCEATKLDLSSFNTASVTDMSYMFENCVNLTEIKGLSSFNTASVTDMSFMFQNCANLTEIKGLSSFNTASVTTMQSMFMGCNKLSSIKLSSFNTENVLNMGGMFWCCYKLESLTLSNGFKFKSGVDKYYMFKDCGKDATSTGSGQGVIYGVTDDAIKTDCKNGGTDWSDTYMKFDGE